MNGRRVRAFSSHEELGARAEADDPVERGRDRDGRLVHRRGTGTDSTRTSRPGASRAAGIPSSTSSSSAGSARGSYARLARRASAGLRFAAVEGTPRCDGAEAAPSGVLDLGKWLETDDATRVRLDVADLGHVEVDPRSRVRVLETGSAPHKLELGRGRLTAKIDAPPRLFVVATKAATAVDLGCAYELSVDERGAGVLRVTSGYVGLEPTATVRGAAGRLSSFVPRGAEAAIDPEDGPGTPVWSDAPAELRDAVRDLDADPSSADALARVLSSARRRDTLSLVHLVERVPAHGRGEVVAKLEGYAKRPPSVPRAKVLEKDTAAIGAWREALRQGW